MGDAKKQQGLWRGTVVATWLAVVLLALGFSPVAWAEQNVLTIDSNPVMHLPDVTDDMANASYWVSKQQDTTTVLADRSTIDALNQAGVDGDGTMLQPLKGAYARFFTQEEQLRVKASIESELRDYLGAEDVNGNALTEEEAAAIAANVPTDGLPPNIASGYAIVVNHTTMRGFPTDRMIGLTPGDADDDNLYISGLRVNEPLLVRAQSVDGEYFLCVSTFFNAAWVPAQDIAICADREEWLAAWDIPEGQELVVTGYKVRTEQSRETPNTANRMLYMGTVLERIDLESPEQALEVVGTRSAYDRYVCYLPVRNDDGTYAKERALIAASADVSAGYLPLTTEGIGDQAFKSLGQMYGWGGMLEANDCSGYVRDVYKCFGLELARDTTYQMCLPVRKYDLEGLDDAHKAAAIAQMPLGTVLFWGGHEMIYLGQENGKLYVISSLGSVGDVYGMGESSYYQIKGVAMNTLDVVRGNGRSWLSTITYANIPYSPESPAGTGVFDIAFYENSVTWPEAVALHTGQPIEPDVTIPWLQAGTDYDVEFSGNKEVGTATVTVTGKGLYGGTTSRMFEIVPPSLEKAKVTVADQCYSGTAVEPAPTVTIGNVTLKPGVDYVSTYANNAGPGTGTVTVSGIGNYTGSASVPFKIGSASLEDADVVVKDQLYTGKEIEPDLKVTLGGVPLDPFTDYRVSYSNNVQVGTATVSISGKGDFIGSTTATFAITRVPLDAASVEVQAQTYTGKALTPDPVVSVGSLLLSRGKDYDVSYTGNVKVGTATLTIVGKGSYAGKKSATFKVLPASLAKAKVTAATKSYTGKKIQPAPTVKLGSTKLVRNVDYTVSYIDNKAVGTALVKVVGKGNYANTAFGTFKITKASQVIKGANKSKKLTASAKTKKLTKNKTIDLKKIAKVSAKTTVRFAKANKSGGSKIVVNASTGKVTAKKGLKKGTYKVKVKLTAKASVSYKAAKPKVITLKIVVA